jgi:hypothetical protein
MPDSVARKNCMSLKSRFLSFAFSKEKHATELEAANVENKELRDRVDKNVEEISQLKQRLEQQSQAQAREKQIRARADLEDKTNGVSFKRAQAVFELCTKFTTLHHHGLQKVTQEDDVELTRILRRKARYMVLNRNASCDFLEAYRCLPDIWRPEFLTEVESALKLGVDASLVTPFASSYVLRELMHFPNGSGARPEAKMELQDWQKLLVALVCPDPKAAESKKEPLLPLQIAGMDLRTVPEIPAKAFYKEHYYLRPDVAAQLLKKDFSGFKPKPANQSGKHVVLPVHVYPSISPDQLPDVVFKLYPEQPGVEQAVTGLGRLIVGTQVVPRSELLRLEFNGQCIPVLMSGYLDGINFNVLLTALEKPETKQDEARQIEAQALVQQTFHTTAQEVIKQFDPGALSELFLMTLFIKPEDGSPSNHTVVRKQNAQGKMVYYLVPHDNDHAFVKEVLLKTTEGYQAEVKSIFYCLDAMQQPIAQEVLHAFLSLQPTFLLSRWLTEQLILTNRYKEIFCAEDVRQLRFQSPDFLEKLWGKTDSGCLIPMPFREGLAGDLWRIFDRLRTILKAKPALTLIEILSFVEPELAKVYQSAFELYPVREESPECMAARLLHVTRHSMSRDRQGHWMTSTRIGEMQKKMLGADISHLSEPEVLRILALEERSARQAGGELDLYAYKEIHFPKIRDEIVGCSLVQMKSDIKNNPGRAKKNKLYVEVDENTIQYIIAGMKEIAVITRQEWPYDSLFPTTFDECMRLKHKVLIAAAKKGYTQNMQGDFERFRLLKSVPACQSEIIAGIDFSKIPHATEESLWRMQELIIQEIKEIPLPRLIIKN